MLFQQIEEGVFENKRIEQQFTEEINTLNKSIVQLVLDKCVAQVAFDHEIAKIKK